MVVTNVLDERSLLASRLIVKPNSDVLSLYSPADVNVGIKPFGERLASGLPKVLTFYVPLSGSDVSGASALGERF
jgi:hypothetical protein